MTSAANPLPTSASLKSISESFVTIHCTVTGQISGRPGYLEEFLRFWSDRPEVKRVWVSLFTPQQGAEGPEILTPSMRREVLDELERLFPLYPKFQMNRQMIEELRHPPQSPRSASSPAPRPLSPLTWKPG